MVIYMDAVKVSSRFQITIPRKVRESLRIRPGEKINVIEYDGLLHLIPIRPMKELRGSLKGIDTTAEREKDRV